MARVQHRLLESCWGCSNLLVLDRHFESPPRQEAVCGDVLRRIGFISPGAAQSAPLPIPDWCGLPEAAGGLLLLLRRWAEGRVKLLEGVGFFEVYECEECRRTARRAEDLVHTAKCLVGETLRVLAVEGGDS